MRKITKKRGNDPAYCQSENAADINYIWRKTGKPCDRFAYIKVEEEDGTTKVYCGPCYGDVRRPDEPQPWDVIYPKGKPKI